MSIPEKKVVKKNAKLIKIFCTVASLNLLIFIFISSSSFFVFEQKMTSSDFLKLRESLLDLSHSANFFNS